MKLLRSDSVAIRRKAVYTLSGLLGHNVPALSMLTKEDWDILRDVCLNGTSYYFPLICVCDEVYR